MESDKPIATQMDYKKFIENSRDMIFRFTPAGEFLYVNNAVTEVTGYEPEALRSMNFYDLLAPEKRMPTRRMLERLAADNVQVSYHETQIHTSDGNVAWLGHNLHLDKEDDTVSFLSI